MSKYILKVFDEKTGALMIALPLSKDRYEDLNDWIESKKTIKELTTKKKPKKTNKKKPAKKTPKPATTSTRLEKARTIYAWCEENLSFKIILFALGAGVLVAELLKGLIFG